MRFRNYEEKVYGVPRTTTKEEWKKLYRDVRPRLKHLPYDDKNDNELFYWRYVAHSNTRVAFIRNNAYFQYQYDLLVYDLQSKKFVHKVFCGTKQEIINEAFIWIMEWYSIQYYPSHDYICNHFYCGTPAFFSL